MGTPKTLQQAIIHFSDADRCFQAAIAFRWPNGLITCPRCGSEKNSFVKTRKIWHCKGCKKQFTVKVGTIFEDSPIGLDKWLCAMWMLANCKNGVSSYEIHRAIGVTQKTAWFMLHRIRLAMKGKTTKKMGGSGEPVQMDETYIAGKPKNMHSDVRVRKGIVDNARAPQAKVFGMIDSRTREVRAVAVPKVNRLELQRIILDNVGFGATVHTDQSHLYHGLRWFTHETVNHMEEYVTATGVTTNSIENFWSCLKRTLAGTYVAVEPAHMDSYLAEATFRFNNRKNMNDGDRFTKALSQVGGKRLTYAELTGANGAH